MVPVPITLQREEVSLMLQEGMRNGHTKAGFPFASACRSIGGGIQHRHHLQAERLQPRLGKLSPLSLGV
jgi:hypothetical protein